MKTTDYAGIDYGLGRTNISDSGIRYGVIPQRDVMLLALGDIFTHGRDLAFEQFQANVKQDLRGALSDYFSDHKFSDEKTSRLDDAVQNAFEAIEQDLNDRYENDSSAYAYEQDGYKLQTDSSGDLWCFESPYFTYAQFCSPCAPGACYLSNPLESPIDGNKCFCLGHDWFDDSKAPYPVYSVETGAIVEPQTAVNS